MLLFMHFSCGVPLPSLSCIRGARSSFACTKLTVLFDLIIGRMHNQLLIILLVALFFLPSFEVAWSVKPGSPSCSPLAAVAQWPQVFPLPLRPAPTSAPASA
jgi:hypothetical protein